MKKNKDLTLISLLVKLKREKTNKFIKYVNWQKNCEGKREEKKREGC
jgi:hypothetical protein